MSLQTVRVMSYETPVVAADESGKVHRLCGYSATAMWHVNAFIADLKIPQGGNLGGVNFQWKKITCILYIRGM